MKKTSGFSIAVFACMLGLVAVSVSVAAASSTHLCKTNPSTHKCSSSDTYPVGTVLTGKLSSSNVSFRPEPNNSTWPEICKKSEFEGTIIQTNDESVPVSIKRLTFSECDEPNISTQIYPEGETTRPWDLLYHLLGTDNGIWEMGTMVKFGLGFARGAPTYECSYQMPTTGELKGGVTPTLVFNGSRLGVHREKPLCPTVLKLYGTYSLSPGPLYVEE